jgi:hypothetical protein
LRGPTNSGNSISSSALNTSSAFIVCLFDSLHMSLALKNLLQKTVQYLIQNKQQK